MSVDREFRIKITTVADASGAKATGKALEDVSEGVKKGTEENKEHGKSFLHAESSGRAFHKLMHEISNTSPELGMALRLALSPVGGLLMGAVMAFQKLKQVEEESINTSAAAGEAAAKPFIDTEQVINNAVDAIHKLDTAYSEWVKNVGEDSKKITTALDLEISKLTQEAAAVKKLIEAKAEAEKAVIDEDKRAGRITPEEAERKKAAVDASTRKGTESVDKTTAMVELAKTEAARDKAAAELAAAIKQSEAAHAAATDPNLTKEASSLEAKAKADKAKAEELRAARVKADEDVRNKALAVEHPGIGDVVLDVLTLPGFKPAGDLRAQAAHKKAEDEADRLKREADSTKTLAEKEDNMAAKAKAALEEKQRASAEANKKVDEAMSQEKALREKAEALKVKSGIDSQSADEMERFKNLKEAQATPFGRAATGDVEDAERTAKALGEHKQVSDQSKEQLVGIASAIAGHQVSLQQAVAMMRTAANNFGTFTSDVLRLVDAMGGLAARTSALKGKVDFIESQVAQIKEQARGAHAP